MEVIAVLKVLIYSKYFKMKLLLKKVIILHIWHFFRKSLVLDNGCKVCSFLKFGSSYFLFYIMGVVCFVSQIAVLLYRYVSSLVDIFFLDP